MGRNELSLQQAEIVVVLNAVSADWGMVKSEFTSKVGLVPLTYLRPLLSQHHMVAIAEHVPRNNSELRLFCGMQVNLIHRYDNNFVMAECDGIVGVCPFSTLGPSNASAAYEGANALESKSKPQSAALKQIKTSEDVQRRHSQPNMTPMRPPPPSQSTVQKLLRSSQIEHSSNGDMSQSISSSVGRSNAEELKQNAGADFLHSASPQKVTPSRPPPPRSSFVPVVPTIHPNSQSNPNLFAKDPMNSPMEEFDLNEPEENIVTPQEMSLLDKNSPRQKPYTVGVANDALPPGPAPTPPPKKEKKRHSNVMKSLIKGKDDRGKLTDQEKLEIKEREKTGVHLQNESEVEKRRKAKEEQERRDKEREMKRNQEENKRQSSRENKKLIQKQLAEEKRKLEKTIAQKEEEEKIRLEMEKCGIPYPNRKDDSVEILELENNAEDNIEVSIQTMRGISGLNISEHQLEQQKAAESVEKSKEGNISQSRPIGKSKNNTKYPNFNTLDLNEAIEGLNNLDSSSSSIDEDEIWTDTNTVVVDNSHCLSLLPPPPSSG